MIVHRDGYTIRVFRSMYVDYGLEITHMEDGEKVTDFYNPCTLSADSWGFDEDEETGVIICWDTARWVEVLAHNADDFLEAYLP